MAQVCQVVQGWVMVTTLLCQVWEVGEGAPARLPRRDDAQDENVKSARGSDEGHPSSPPFLLPLSAPATDPAELQLLVLPQVNPGQGLQSYLREKKRRNY